MFTDLIREYADKCPDISDSIGAWKYNDQIKSHYVFCMML